MTARPERRPGMPSARYLVALAALLVLATFLRFPLLGWAADSYRLTEAFSIEEVENIRISSGMLHERTANPHAFEYPSAFYYLSLLVEAPIHAQRGPDWTAYLVAVRSISLLCGLAVLVLAAEIARRLGGDMAGILAATLLATDCTMIELSTIAKPNMLQLALLLAGFLALLALARTARLRTACTAALFFALATASKWLGALGLVGLVVAPALAAGVRTAADPARGVGGILGALRRGLATPIRPIALALPGAVFAVTILVAMPYALLSPKEFGYGLAQVFFAQAGNRRPLPASVSLEYVLASIGPVGAVLLVGGVLWGVWRLLRWNGDARSNGLVLVVGWALAYGALVLFVFARLPSYIDLWVPFLAVLAGLAWAGEERWLAPKFAPVAMILLALVASLASNGAYASSRRAAIETSPRMAAGRWLAEHARSTDSVVADLGVFVPDSLVDVRWNWWGNPPRVFYDETVTWGDDPVWTDNWYGGHRRIVFVNARWAPPESLLATRPRFVATHADWVRNRRQPGRSTYGAVGYDAALADGSAGYVEAAAFGLPGAGADTAPEVRIFERRDTSVAGSAR